MAVACSSSKHSTATLGAQQTASGDLQDGSGVEKAVVIRAKDEAAGVTAEYKWLQNRYPGYTSKQQALASIKGKSYDVLTIETADGVEKTVYFDISNYFGKF